MRLPIGIARPGLLAMALLTIAPAAGRAAVTFLGQVGASATGRASASWIRDGVADSTVATFGMTPGAIYQDTTFESSVTHSLPDLDLVLNAGSHLTLGPSGPASRMSPVATGRFGVYAHSIPASPAHAVVSTLDLDLCYEADQPVVYWELVETWSGSFPPWGPPGDTTIVHPAASDSVTYWSPMERWRATVGSAPNTGALALHASSHVIRTEGVDSDWFNDEGLLVYLSATPLDAHLSWAPRGVPAVIALAAPRPNPAAGATVFDVAMPVAGRATLEILDVSGRRVRTLVDGVLPAGTTGARWDGADARGVREPAGVYFARLVSGGETHVRRLVLMR